MSSETDYTASLDEWSPLLARHLPLAEYLAKTEPYRETIVRKVPAQTPPVPPAPKKQQPPQRGARRRSWRGYGGRVQRQTDEQE
jgi:ribosomal protein S30